MSCVCTRTFHMLMCMQTRCVTEREKYNLHEIVTSFQAICQAEQHLEEVTKERSLYKTAIDTAKQSIRQFFSSDGVFSLPQPACKSQPCSRLIKAHYSFDMAQQVFYPNDPQQPGPMYFLTPRKCAIFRVCCEAIPRQVNYLIDESVDTGLAREQTPSSACSITSSKYMGLESRTSTSMLTTVGVKIRTTPW